MTADVLMPVGAHRERSPCDLLPNRAAGEGGLFQENVTAAVHD